MPISCTWNAWSTWRMNRCMRGDPKTIHFKWVNSDHEKWSHLHSICSENKTTVKTVKGIFYVLVSHRKWVCICKHTHVTRMYWFYYRTENSYCEKCRNFRDFLATWSQSWMILRLDRFLNMTYTSIRFFIICVFT